MFPWNASPEDIEAAHQRSQIEYSEKRHQLYRVLEGLDQEQMDVVHTILIGIVTAGHDGPVLANLYVGILTELRSQRFGICPACGSNHLEEAAAATTEETPTDA